MTSNPFVPNEEFLRRRAREYVESEQRRMDAELGGWEQDRRGDLVEWLSRIDRQRGELAQILINGGKWRGFDRKQALLQLVKIAALSKRAIAVLAAEIHEAQGEHVDDSLMDMFRTENPNGMASPKAAEEIPF